MNHTIDMIKNSTNELIMGCSKCNISKICIDFYEVKECQPEKNTWMTLHKNSEIPLLTEVANQ